MSWRSVNSRSKIDRAGSHQELVALSRIQAIEEHDWKILRQDLQCEQHAPQHTEISRTVGDYF
jgi:hypothetical protein